MLNLVLISIASVLVNISDLHKLTKLRASLYKGGSLLMFLTLIFIISPSFNSALFLALSSVISFMASYMIVDEINRSKRWWYIGLIALVWFASIYVNYRFVLSDKTLDELEIHEEYKRRIKEYDRTIEEYQLKIDSSQMIIEKLENKLKRYEEESDYDIGEAGDARRFLDSLFNRIDHE